MCFAGSRTLMYFNSQPHKEADLPELPLKCQYRSYFNSQPHKEADRHEVAVWCSSDISTHSLTRRLTGADTLRDHADKISTHSLTRRLTEKRVGISKGIENFNSQPHKEADTGEVIEKKES